MQLLCAKKFTVHTRKCHKSTPFCQPLMLLCFAGPRNSIKDATSQTLSITCNYHQSDQIQKEFYYLYRTLILCPLGSSIYIRSSKPSKLKIKRTSKLES